jgi:hypothetical protein
MLRKIILPSVIGVILLMNVPVQAGEIIVSGLLKRNSGKYVYSDNTNTTYLYSTLKYKTDHYFVSVGLPFIAQNTDLITHMGGGIIPSEHGHDDQSSDEGHNHGMFSGGQMGDHAMNWAIGDIYFNFEKPMFNEMQYIPSFSFTALIKFPTASTEKNLGTGEIDYGFGISANKNLGLIYGFWDINYYFLGDPNGFDLKNPIGFGLGLGFPASNNRLSLLAYYSGYTEILPGIEPPRELSINISYRLNQKYLLNSGITYGFSESSPKYGFFFGADMIL